MKKEKTEKGNVGRLFRTLIRFCFFPVKADFEKKTLKLNFCSKAILIYTIYISFPLFAAFVPSFIIGYSRVLEYFLDLIGRSTATENISIFGAFINVFVFQGYFITFLKKLGMKHQSQDLIITHFWVIQTVIVNKLFKSSFKVELFGFILMLLLNRTYSNSNSVWIRTKVAKVWK